MGKEFYSHLLRVGLSDLYYLSLALFRKEEFRKGPKVYQRRLEEIEQKAYTREQKVEVLRSLKSADHEYLSFFVCRNPIEKLVSVYKYMKVLKYVT